MCLAIGKHLHHKLGGETRGKNIPDNNHIADWLVSLKRSQITFIDNESFPINNQIDSVVIPAFSLRCDWAMYRHNGLSHHT